MKEWKNKKNFAGIRGQQGGRRTRDALQCIFCVCKPNFYWHLFFHFGIDTVVAIQKIEFANDFFHKGIGLNFQTWI